MAAGSSVLGDASHLAATLLLSVAALGTLILLIYQFKTAPMDVLSREFVMVIFGASNIAQLASVVLLVWQLCQREGAKGLSLNSQRLSLLAVTLRATFAMGGGASTHNVIELTLIAIANLLIVLMLEPSIARRIPYPKDLHRTGALPDGFSSPEMLWIGVGGCTLVIGGGYAWQMRHEGFAYIAIAFSKVMANLIQAAAVLPQRSALLRTRRLPALTSHAFILSLISVGFRLLLWLLLCLELEFHPLYMLSDFVYIGLLADYTVVYVRSLREQGLEGLFRQDGMRLHVDV